MRLRPHDLQLIAILALVANVALAVTLVLTLKDLIMKHRLTLGAVALAAVAAAALSGCAGLPVADRTQALKYGLEHIEGCDRTYTGGTGVGAAFTFNIVCRARDPAGAAVTPLRDLGKAPAEIEPIT